MCVISGKVLISIHTDIYGGRDNAHGSIYCHKSCPVSVHRLLSRLRVQAQLDREIEKRMTLASELVRGFLPVIFFSGFHNTLGNVSFRFTLLFC